MSLIKQTKSKYSKLKQFKLNSPLVTRILFGALLLFLISLIFNIDIKLILFWVIVIFVNISMENVRLRANLPADFELSTFSTILVTVAFGWKWGILTAIFSKFITSIATGNLLVDHFFMMGTYVLGAVIASILPITNVFLLGMIIVSINCVLMFLISKNFLGLGITSNLAYTTTNFAFNFIIFSILGNFVYGIL